MSRSCFFASGTSGAEGRGGGAWSGGGTYVEAAGAAAGVPGDGESMVDSSGNSVGVHGDTDLSIGASSSAPSSVPLSVLPLPVCVPCMGSSVSPDGTAGAGGCDCEPEESGP